MLFTYRKQPTADCGVEARELFTKLLAMSEQVLGPSVAIKILQVPTVKKEALELGRWKS
jgi:hypothetical protein